MIPYKFNRLKKTQKEVSNYLFKIPILLDQEREDKKE
jgi:hypothetical protein